MEYLVSLLVLVGILLIPLLIGAFILEGKDGIKFFLEFDFFNYFFFFLMGMIIIGGLFCFGELVYGIKLAIFG